MKASTISFRMAVIFIITGVLMGIAMAITGHHEFMPAHAHLNLLGWVSLFLFGIFYKLHPSVDGSMLARVQAIWWAAGSFILAGGVALVHSGHQSGEPLAVIGSLLIAANLIVLAKLVFRETA